LARSQGAPVDKESSAYSLPHAVCGGWRAHKELPVDQDVRRVQAVGASVVLAELGHLLDHRTRRTAARHAEIGARRLPYPVPVPDASPRLVRKDEAEGDGGPDAAVARLSSTVDPARHAATRAEELNLLIHQQFRLISEDAATTEEGLEAVTSAKLAAIAQPA